MENLRNIYDLNTEYILGAKDDYFRNIRDHLIKNFFIDNKLIKNNESIKHIDPKVYRNIYFRSNDAKLSYQTLKNNNLDPSIVVNDGLKYDLINLDPSKVNFSPLSTNLDLLIQNIENNKNRFNNDYIVNLNSIFLNSGFNLSLNESNHLKLSLIHKNDKLDNTIFSKNFFHIQKNSKLILIEKFINSTLSSSNVINYFELEEGSEVIHLVVQKNTDESNLQFTTHANCQKNSIFNQLIFNCSEISGRNHHYATLTGEQSEANLKGIFFAKKNQIIDNKTEVSNLGHSCLSNQIYKGVLTDNARASYLSKTFVHKLAQKTDGYQLSKAILLSDFAFFHSKPELKIYADDVKCSHGSTIGPFDKEVIYYLRSRGLDENKAKSILVNSFCQDLLSCVKDESYLKDIRNLIHNWLLKNVN